MFKKRIINLFLVCFFSVVFFTFGQNEYSKNNISNNFIKEGYMGLEKQDREIMANKLNTLLANMYVLYTKTLNYHWNVYGPFFNDLHKFFQTLYEQQQMHVDAIAERVRALDVISQGSLTEFLQNSQIQDQAPGVVPDSSAMVNQLLSDYQIIIGIIRKDIDYSADINDMGTNNFLSDLIEQLEKNAWMLRALLK